MRIGLVFVLGLPETLCAGWGWAGGMATADGNPTRPLPSGLAEAVADAALKRASERGEEEQIYGRKRAHLQLSTPKIFRLFQI